MASHIVSIPLPAAVDDCFVLRAPESAEGGAITIRGAEVVNHATTSSTVSFTVALHAYSNAGTPAVNGTVAAAQGGTADHWADNIPKELTLTDTQLEAGEYLVLSVAAQGGGAPTRGYLMLRYEDGK